MQNKVVEKKIKECFAEIDSVKNTLDKFKIFDKERQYLTKYILIYISGILEISYKTLISDYCLKQSNVHVHNFFETIIIKKSKNATLDNICETLCAINPNLNKTFKNRLNTNKHRDVITSALKSLSTLRHSFAHGILTETVYFSDIEKYYVQAVKMLIILDKTLSSPDKIIVPKINR